MQEDEATTPPTPPQSIRAGFLEQFRRRREAEAEAFLLHRLAPGPGLVKEVKVDAKRRGVSWAGVRIARHVLGVQSKPTDKGQVWSLGEGFPTNTRDHVRAR